MKAKGLTTAAFLGMLLVGGLAKAQNAAPAPMPQGEKGKAEWIKANPDAYRQMGGQGATTSKAEIKATQSGAMTEAEKIAWVKSHPAEYAKLAGSVQAAPKSDEMPRYMDTGNPQADAYAHEMAKQAWYAAHPTDPSQLPDYPRFVDTGNPTADMARYNQAKAEFKLRHHLGDAASEGTRPVYVNTGNEAKDLENYNKAKAAYNAQIKIQD